MTFDEAEASFRDRLNRALGDYGGDRVDIDLRVRDADSEKLHQMLWARSVLGARSRVRQDDIDGMRRRLERVADRGVAESYSIDMSLAGAPHVTIERIVWRSRSDAP